MTTTRRHPPRALPPMAAAARDDTPHVPALITLRPCANARGATATEYELLVYGHIGDSWWDESTTARGVVEQLQALPEGVETIHVRINSYGGAVADGLAIYNALRRAAARIEVTVDGVAMSSASLIAMAGDTVTMPATSLLMIHAPWGGVLGNATELRQYADILDKHAAAMASAYARKSGMDHADALALLTDGQDHYYTGTEAVAAGFADAAPDDDDQAEELDGELAAAASGGRHVDSDAAWDLGAALLARMGSKARRRHGAAVALAALAGWRPRGIPGATAAPDNTTPDTPASRPTTSPASAAVDPPPAAAGTTEDNIMDPEKIKAATQAALAADKKRRDDIRARFAPFIGAGRADEAELLALRQRCEDSHDTTAEAAGAQLLEALARQAEPVAAAGRIEPGSQDETVNYRAGAAQSVIARAMPSEPVDERAREFRGFSLYDLARDTVERAGGRTRGMSRQEVAVRALQSTSDFPAILEDVISKTLRRGYAATPRTFTPFCRQATLPDFRDVSRTQISGAPDLKRVLEGAEYEYGALTDGAEKYRVQKYGRVVAITWETIINDDLDALTRIPQMFGASAAALESDIVYAVLTGNPAMSDSKTLFHSDHGNIGSSASLLDEINPDTSAARPISEMREKMLLQQGLEGRYISVVPRYLIVPPRQEGAALKVTTGTVANRPLDQNPFGPSLRVISEPRLQAASADAWYGAADPSQIDTIEYAYLQGHEGVFTESRAGFEVDGVQVKCRHVFGAKAIDWRGLYYNAGATPAPWPPES